MLELFRVMTDQNAIGQIVRRACHLYHCGHYSPRALVAIEVFLFWSSCTTEGTRRLGRRLCSIDGIRSHWC
jgi:hypothetical protein